MRKTQGKAHQGCEDDGAHLVTIDNKEEDEFVSRVIVHCNPEREFWIGLSVLEQEGRKRLYILF